MICTVIISPRLLARFSTILMFQRWKSCHPVQRWLIGLAPCRMNILVSVNSFSKFFLFRHEKALEALTLKAEVENKPRFVAVVETLKGKQTTPTLLVCQFNSSIRNTNQFNSFHLWFIHAINFTYGLYMQLTSPFDTFVQMYNGGSYSRIALDWYEIVPPNP